MRKVIITALVGIISMGMLFAQGTVTGIVTGDDGTALPGVNVYLEGTNLGAATDADGNYTIANVPAGDYTIIASAIGYKTGKDAIVVTEGAVTASFTLGTDILGMDAVIVTGVLNPVTKLESSVAISTVNSEEIALRAPRNTADLLKAIPGFYVESSGGEGGNNLFARGIPADGSFRYVSLQEDGLPVFEDGELMFGNADLFLRVDETVDRMEGVRGGTGSIYASNAPGGIINLISKTGGASTSGLAKLTLGDYGLYRTDVNIGGPINNDWRYNMGGFYRYDRGIRPPGFTANQGGQIKGNFTRLLDNGYIRANFKLMDDRNIFYLPIPLQDKDNPSGITGFDPNYGTMTSLDINYLSVPIPGGGTEVQHIEDGMHPQIVAVGGELFYEFENGWTMKNVFRNTVNDEEFNAIFSLWDPFNAHTYAQGFVDANEEAAGYEYRFARTGAAIGTDSLTMATLNDNGLVAEVGWWNVQLPMSNFANDLRLSKSFAGHNITLGLYHTDWKVNSVWYWHNVLAEVRGGKEDQTRALDVVLIDSSGADLISVTSNGLSNIGSFYQGYGLDAVSNAYYVNDEFTVSDALRLDIGVRLEFGTITGYAENLGSYDLGDTTTLADDAVSYGDGTFNPYTFEYDELAWSIGANYKLSDGMAVFGRFSDGFRTPDDQHFVFNDPASYKVEQVFQYEGGLKYSSPNLGLFASFFGINFANIPFSDEVVEDGEIIRAFRFADSQNMGLELEAIAKFGALGLDITATVQNPQYKNYVYYDYDDPAADPTEYDFDGNKVRRIPQMFFSVRPSYDLGNITLHADYRYFGERFVDDANNNILPAWGAINAGATIGLGDFTLAMNGHNLTNTIGLTEGNPRAGQIIGAMKDIYMARPIMGRSLTAYLTYNF